MSEQTLGALLAGARAAHDLSLQEVAVGAGCSSGYVHKLEADLVHTPSPRVLAGLAAALGLTYGDMMTAAGYDVPPSHEGGSPKVPTAIKRYSNAHIVELLERLQDDMGQVRSMLESKVEAG
jgi:transcriptional regulator with XRE-family HTH domain